MELRNSVICLSAVVLLLCAARAEAGRLKGDGVEGVSLINLIATPSRYHHKKVRIEGFACVEFEGNALYLSRDDLNYLIPANAVWLKLDKDGPDRSQYNGKWVLIEGTFNAKEYGHGGMYSGMIEDIQRIEFSRKYYDY